MNKKQNTLINTHKLLSQKNNKNKNFILDSAKASQNALYNHKENQLGPQSK